MLRLRSFAAFLCLLGCSAPSLLAWNATGHRAITFLAYSHLTPKARARVDAILRAHPDYAEMFAKGNAADPVDVAHNAFAAASVWSDVIKGDPRFSDKADGPMAPVLPGFPDMLRHQNWHYTNAPYQKEFEKAEYDSVNAISEIHRLMKVLRKDGPVTPEEAFVLPWIMHIVTDLHQPLHASSRFAVNAQGKVDHDRGGNYCNIVEDKNLHAVWDNILGVNTEEGAVARLAASLSDHQAEPKKLDLKPETWLKEGGELAQTFVYAFPGDCSVKDRPLKLPAGYKSKAHQIALQRGAIAAYRLAAILNNKFD